MRSNKYESVWIVAEDSFAAGFVVRSSRVCIELSPLFQLKAEGLICCELLLIGIEVAEARFERMYALFC